jgi:DeoR/GlpR family transcriptional regulator of sugar metabolism
LSADLKISRHQAILDRLAESGRARVAELADGLGVSTMTLRRDLEELEERGSLKRVHGGAVLTRATGSDPGYWLRHRQARAEKRKIGQLAASLVRRSESVYLDTGSTAVEVARALAARCVREQIDIRVATHAVNVAAELASAPGISAYLVGGEVSPETLGTFGPDAVREIARLNVDIFFLGVTGVDAEHGFTNSSAVGLEVKRALLKRARRTYVVADGSKWGRTSLLTVCGLEDVDGWVCDRGLARGALRALSQTRLELLRTP